MNKMFESVCHLVVPSVEKRYWRKLEDLVCSGFAPSVILDLEDSISPEHKESARGTIWENKERVRNLVEKCPHVFVRINAIETEFFGFDLTLLQKLYKEGIRVHVVVPKVSSAEVLNAVAAALPDRAQRFFVGIETICGLRKMEEILAHPRVAFCTLGLEDLTAEMGIPRPLNVYGNRLLERILTEVAFRAAMHDVVHVAPIWPFMNYPELVPSFIEEIKGDLSLGMRGLAIFHPYQIEYARFFWANRTLADGYRKAIDNRKARLVEKMSNTPSACGVFDFKMVDVPELKRR